MSPIVAACLAEGDLLEAMEDGVILGEPVGYERGEVAVFLSPWPWRGTGPPWPWRDTGPMGVIMVISSVGVIWTVTAAKWERA